MRKDAFHLKWRYRGKAVIPEKVEEPITLRLYGAGPNLSKIKADYCGVGFCAEGIALIKHDYRYVLKVSFHEPGSYKARGKGSVFIDKHYACLIEEKGLSQEKDSLLAVNDDFIDNHRGFIERIIADGKSGMLKYDK